MKKRFFAGLLACLMVVGLLPLSMLLKPVNAKAATGKKMEFVPADSYESHSNYDIVSAGDFNIYWKSGMKTEIKPLSWGDGVRFENRFSTNGKMNYGTADKTTKRKAVVGAIGFSTNKASKVKVYWSSKNSTIKLRLATLKESALTNVEDSSAPQNGSYGTEYSEFDVESTDELVTYYLGGDTNAVYIYKIIVEELGEDTETKYNVTVIDSESTDSEVKKGKVIEKTEGETLELSAEGDNFAYWENSQGYVVSREKKISFPVYFADTYTAVYKSDVTIEYLTPYGQTYKEFSSVDEIGAVEGPTRYGYEFVKWSKDLNTIKAELAKGNTTVVVSPVYKEASDTFDIEIVLDDASQGVVKYPINTVVNADASSLDNFAYWEDGDGNKLSYNAKYSFYANKDMVVKAVTSTTAVNSDVIIRTVKAPTIIGNSGDKVAIFEFNVPDGAQIKYAGVVADTDKNNLTLQNAKYKLGNFVNSDILTYKYTLTKRSSMTDTIYVKPVIKYTMNGAEYEKYGTMVEEL